MAEVKKTRLQQDSERPPSEPSIEILSNDTPTTLAEDQPSGLDEAFSDFMKSFKEDAATDEGSKTRRVTYLPGFLFPDGKEKATCMADRTSEKKTKTIRIHENFRWKKMT